MNPLPMLSAELRGLRWIAPAIVLLVMLAVMIGIAINAQERALRKGSALAAEDFDLLIGAPGSQMQLVLTGVFLQQEALPLLPGDILPGLLADKRVRAAAPIAGGDLANGYPIIGTTVDFATRWGRLAPNEGRVFAAPGEAVAGADVAMPLGTTMTPSHALAGVTHHPGETSEEEVEHRHGDTSYTLVGRLPKLGTPWDRAILVPVESVWAVHGLGSRWPVGADRQGPLPGVPIIVVKPKGVAEAYALRAEFRQGGTMAFFPAEVLVQLYSVLGDARTVLVTASVLNAVLIFAAVLVLIWAVTVMRRRRYAVLRALGAPRSYLLLVVWLNAAILLTLGCLLGLLAGWGMTGAVGALVARETGLALDFVFGADDLLLALALVAGGSTLALVPAALTYRLPVAEGLRLS
jgi:putative ABC transport system permease protein